MRLVGLLSFLGWSQRVGAFSFHSLSCFCGTFGADSVGKKIGKRDGLMCVIDSDVMVQNYLRFEFRSRRALHNNGFFSLPAFLRLPSSVQIS